MENVEKVLAELPPAARKELLDYAEFLREKYKKKAEGLPSPGRES